MFYGAYLLPSVLFAAYGVWRKDFVAALVAYVVLLVVVLLYIGWVHGASKALRSALEKYEARTGALQESRGRSQPFCMDSPVNLGDEEP